MGPRRGEFRSAGTGFVNQKTDIPGFKPQQRHAFDGQGVITTSPCRRREAPRPGRSRSPPRRDCGSNDILQRRRCTIQTPSPVPSGGTRLVRAMGLRITALVPRAVARRRNLRRPRQEHRSRLLIRPFERWRSPSRATWGTPLTNRRAGWVRLMRSRRFRRSSRKSSRRSGNSLFPAEGDRRLGPEALGTSPQRAEAACRASGMRVAGPIGVRKTRTVLRNTRATAA